MPLLDTQGSDSADAYGGGAAAIPNYIEDVFSTYLYTGNNNNPNTITNGIDLAGKGGLVWIKSRSGPYNPGLIDTARGRASELHSNTSGAQDVDTSPANGLTSFNANGFTLGNDEYTVMNSGGSSFTYASWTFRKQPNFFDIVTWTGDNSSTRQINHNLGVTPAFIIIKRTDTTANWVVAALNSATSYSNLRLNTTAAEISRFGAYPSGSAYTSSTQLGVGWWSGGGAATLAETNATGGTYIAYLFAHNAGGFGLTGTDNVISCGSFTYSGSAVEVNLGYEPQFILAKGANRIIDWEMYDVMRRMPAGTGSNIALLVPNTSAAESVAGYPYHPTATGFIVDAGYYSNPTTVIYIAIRRGPMKVPTDATKVFAPVAYTGNGSSTRALTAGFPVDMFINNFRNVAGGGGDHFIRDRLRGGTVNLSTNSTGSESTAYTVGLDSNTQILNIPSTWDNYNTGTFVDYFWQRAPSFFDEVCYTGTGSAGFQVTHNLTVAPELLIVKARNNNATWAVYAAPLGATKYLQLESSSGSGTLSAFWNDTAPTSSVFTIGNAGAINDPATKCVAYLFATCAGVSKVGSYTGTGATQTISCGFTGGARFVLIKRTDSTGNWETFDTARGMTSGADPHLELNTTNAETNANWVYTTTGGFQIVTSDANVNANGGSYIFLAIA